MNFSYMRLVCEEPLGLFSAMDRAGPNETEADGGGNIQVRFSKSLI